MCANKYSSRLLRDADGRPAPVTEKQRQWIRSRVREELEHKALQQRVQNGETDTVL